MNVLTPYKVIENRINQATYHPVMEYPSFKNKEALKQYQQQVIEGEKLFKHDLLEVYDLENHPKAQKAVDLAWKINHSVGFYDVLELFEELIELL